jgi:hypothetical protein
MGRWRTIRRAYGRHRFAALFVTLVATLAAGATLDTLFPTYNPLQLLLALTLLAAIANVAHEGNMRGPVAVGVAFVVVRCVQATLGIPGLLAVSEALWVIAIALAAVAGVRHAFRVGVVDRERIFAALDTYLLAGLLFAAAYLTTDRVWQRSFAGETAGGPLDLAHAIYFSFVTIATLGYGDVVPVSPPARGLAIVEGVGGQMYLAVLVARLVSLYAKEWER